MLSYEGENSISWIAANYKWVFWKLLITQALPQTFLFWIWIEAQPKQVMLQSLIFLRKKKEVKFEYRQISILDFF